MKILSLLFILLMTSTFEKAFSAEKDDLNPISSKKRGREIPRSSVTTGDTKPVKESIDLETPKTIVLHVLNQDVGQGQKWFDDLQRDCQNAFERKGYKFAEGEFQKYFSLGRYKDVWEIFKEIDQVEKEAASYSPKPLPSLSSGYLEKSELSLNYTVTFETGTSGTYQTVGKRVKLRQFLQAGEAFDIQLDPLENVLRICSHSLTLQAPKRRLPLDKEKPWEALLGFSSSFFSNLWVSPEHPDIIHTFGIITSSADSMATERQGLSLTASFNLPGHQAFKMVCDQKQNLKKLDTSGALHAVAWAI